MKDCIFCKIVAGEIPSEKVFADDQITVFKDINPAAPIHLLIIPNKHIASMNDATLEDEHTLGKMQLVAQQLAVNFGIAESGYRMIINTGDDGGQVVHHIHLHLLGGQAMRYPMG